MKAGRIKKCPSCKAYTLRDVCVVCGVKTFSPHPVHFTPSAKYADLILRARRDSRLYNGRGMETEWENGSGNRDKPV